MENRKDELRITVAVPSLGKAEENAEQTQKEGSTRSGLLISA